MGELAFMPDSRFRRESRSAMEGGSVRSVVSVGEVSWHVRKLAEMWIKKPVKTNHGINQTADEDSAPDYANSGGPEAWGFYDGSVDSMGSFGRLKREIIGATMAD